MSRPTASSITWCACWWAPWWTWDSIDGPSPTSRPCWSGRDNSETSPPAPPQGLYFVAATYPSALYADEAEEAHAGAEHA